MTSSGAYLYKNIKAYLYVNTRMCLCVNTRMHKYANTYTRIHTNTHMCMCAFYISDVKHFRRVQRIKEMPDRVGHDGKAQEPIDS